MEKLYFASIPLTGLSVFAVNIYNIPHKMIQQSPTSEKQRLYFKYYMVSLMKGTIYGAYAPFSTFMMLIDSQDKKAFRLHTNPCSVYFKYIKR